MHPALFKLIVLSLKAGLRRAFRGARTVKGAFLTLFTIGVLLLMIGPSVFVTVKMRGQSGMPQFGGWLEPYLPLMLLGFCLLIIFGPAGEMAIAFTPAEVDFLFPAPFERRELLGYKLAKLLLGSVLMALFFSMSFLLYLNSWYAAVVGIFLTMAFTQLLALTVALVGQIVAEHAYTKLRRAILLGMGLLVAVGLAQMLAQAPIQNISALALSFRSTWTGRVILAPFEVFSHTILAGNVFPQLIGWGLAAAAIDLGLLVLVVKLDADYVEGAAAISQKLYERMQRRKGGGVALRTTKIEARLRVPKLPWFGGAGPLAWRQLLIALRTSRLIVLISLGIGCMLLVMALFMPSERLGSEFLIPSMGVGFIAYLTFLFAMQLPWAFRGDIDHIDSLKALPVAPLALASGELAGGVLVLASIQLVVLVALLAAGGNPALILTAAAFLVPFDVIMLGVSNTLFLIYPVRIVQTGAPDFQLMGRMMLLMLLQFLVLIPGLGIPAALGGLAFWLSGSWWQAFAGTSWLLLAAEIPLVLFALAWVFQRFDPSTEMPG